jgi:SanA protein
MKPGFKKITKQNSLTFFVSSNMNVKQYLRRFFVLGICLSFALLIFIAGLNIYVHLITKNRIKKDYNNLPNAYCAIVLGAKVREGGQLSLTLQDRMVSALELYRAQKIKKFLLSGDYSRPDYNEVGAMRLFLLKNNVPDSIIYLDPKGFDTYLTMTRAKQIYKVKDAIIVTQSYHLTRSMYLASKVGIDCYGYIADKRKNLAQVGYQIRDWLALTKAFIKIISYDSTKSTGESNSVYDKRK